MKFFILSGSHRQEAQTLKVAKYIQGVLTREHPGAEAHLYSLSGNPLPLWDETTGGAPDELWDPISAELKAADALVVVTPEWSGMATPGVKNFLLNCTAGEIGHKPGLIVTVSATRGGSYPVAELRMSGYKNNRLCWIPEHVIIHHAEQNLNLPDGAADLDRLGKPYEQSGDAEQRQGGSGLGLSLVRAFAKLHGGDMTIESAEGEGTTVTVRLPVLIPLATPRGMPAEASRP